MIRTDERSGIVAIIPDRLLNPAPGATGDQTMLDELLEVGAGIMTLPPATGSAVEVATIARDAVDYLNHGYRVVAFDFEQSDAWAPELHRELARWNRSVESITLGAGVITAALRGEASPFVQANAPGAAELATGRPALTIDDSTIWRGSSDPTAPVVLLMHGYGGAETDFLPYVDRIPERFAVAMVRAPLDTPEGRWAWFPAGEPGTPLRVDADAAEAAVIAWLDRTVAGRVVVPFGFSQGGALAIMLLRTRPVIVPAAGAIAGFTLPVDATGNELLAATRPPFFAAWDPADPVVIPLAVERTATWLAAHTTTTFHAMSGGLHEIDDASMAAFGDFLEALHL